VAFNRDDFVTEKVFYGSFDGTRIPLFITRRKDAKLDGSERCILYGYGGFNVSLTPGFSPVNVAWVERGGIYAVACIRGGGEYGAAWHQAAIKEKRPVAFKDFMAAGEFLVKGRYTSPKRLAIRGGSNGGLLVGAVMTQRPDLIGAAIPEVGVMDMLRFHTFTIGWAWKTDYGTSEDPAMFQVLNAYSPYHALLRAKPGTLYPPTLVTTADHDDRVVPGHSFKFAAALQATGSPTGTVDPARPLLIRIEESAGHGAGKPTQKSIDQNTDILAFLEWVMK
jgi:prolyl oligopeptidase